MKLPIRHGYWWVIHKFSLSELDIGDLAGQDAVIMEDVEYEPNSQPVIYTRLCSLVLEDDLLNGVWEQTLCSKQPW